MRAGEIKDNTSHYAPICDHGGGDSTVTISGGKIYGNKVTGNVNIQGCGGAIYSNRKVVITGGEIYNNTAEKLGGAIYMPMGADTHIDGGTSLTITGGTITGNKCTSGVGDGIYVLTHNGFGGNFIVGGAAHIEGVYLPDSSYMLIESALTGEIELECENPSRYTPNTLVARPYGSYAITQNDISKLEYKDGEYGIDFKMNSTTDVVLTAPFCNIYYELTNLTATEDSATRGNDSLTDEFYGYITADEGYVLPPLSAVIVKKGGEPANPSLYYKGFDGDDRLKITFKSGLFKDPGDVTVTAIGVPKGEAVTDPVAWNVQQNKYYTEVNKALDAVTPGQTVMLLKDAGFEGYTDFTCSFTLDLNGYILTTEKTVDGGYAFDVYGSWGKNITLTIMDSSPNAVHTSIQESIPSVPEGAEITGGILNNQSGDGICVQGYGTLILNGGSIAGCAGSGVNLRGGGSLEMNGGSIQYNKKSGSGGGIYFTSYSSGTVAISGGTIAHNEGTNGGGMYISGSRPITMTGGTITDNKATSNGGGVCLNSETSFTMSGDARITGNTSAKNGGGVYLDTRGSISLSDAPVVRGNTGGGSGVYIANSTTSTGEERITLTEALTAGADIHLRAAGEKDGFVLIKPETGYEITEGDLGKFSYDTLDYALALVEEKIVLKKVEIIEDDPVVEFDDTDADTGLTAESFDGARDSVLKPGLDNLGKDVQEEYRQLPDGLYYIHVETKLDIKVLSYVHPDGSQRDNVLKLEITPMYQVVATNSEVPPSGAGGGTEEVLSKDKPGADVNGWIKMEVNDPVDLTIPLPEGFAVEGAEIYIKHTETKDSKTHWYFGTVKEGKAVFNDPDGFSIFEIHNTLTAQARIGDQYYDTLQEALDDVKPGETITVLTEEHLEGTVQKQEMTFKVEGEGDLAPDVTIRDNGDYHVSQDGNTYTVTYVEPIDPPAPPIDPPAPSTYPVIVTPPEHGGVQASPSQTVSGGKVTLTVTPDEGYVPGTLTVTDRNGKAVEYKDNGDGTYTFTMPAGGVTVTVKFDCMRGELCPLWPFTDVDRQAWYHDGAHYCVEHGLMVGTSATTFAPGGTTTRAEMVTILYRLDGEPAVTADIPFEDVPAGQWYSDAINWAAANEIVNGYGNGKFGPNDTITREQMAAILYRYASYKGYDMTKLADLTGYTDAGEVSGWAVTSMRWAVAEGIIEGMTTTTLSPSGDSTRAQVATIFMRFCKGVAK